MQSITQEQLTEAIKPPNDFGYHGDLPIGRTWSLGPVIETRDSGPLEKANSRSVREAFEKIFGDEGEEQGWEVTRCNHWAVGWVEHLSFKAIDDNGGPSAQFIEMLRLNAEVEENCVLDEDLLCEIEWEETIEYLEWNASRFVKDDAPDDWVELLARQVSSQVIHESSGPYIRDEDIKDGLRKLELLDTSDEEDGE